MRGREEEELCGSCRAFMEGASKVVKIEILHRIDCITFLDKHKILKISSYFNRTSYKLQKSQNILYRHNNPLIIETIIFIHYTSHVS